MKVLEIHSLSCWYPKRFFKRFEVLQDINLTLKRGEIVGLVGENGAGKTTLIKSILGLNRFFEGEILYNGQQQTADRKWLNGVGYAPEFPNLPDNISGRSFVQLFGQFYDLNRKALKRRTAVVLESLDLSEFADRKMGKYSKGMKKRIVLAQALFHDPDLMLLDEPLEGIDPRRRARVKEYLQDCCLRGASVLISSHEILELEQLCDRLVEIHQGEIRMVN